MRLSKRLVGHVLSGGGGIALLYVFHNGEHWQIEGADAIMKAVILIVICVAFVLGSAWSILPEKFS